MIGHIDFVNYMKDIAIHNKWIKHTEESKSFHEIDMQTISGDTSGMFAEKCLLIETQSGRVTGPNWNTLYDTPDFAFVVAKACRVGDIDQEREILEETKRVGFQIYSKIKRDYHAGHPLMKLVDISSLSYQKIYGFGDNHFGFRFTLSMKASEHLKYNEDDWDY